MAKDYVPEDNSNNVKVEEELKIRGNDLVSDLGAGVDQLIVNRGPTVRPKRFAENRQLR